PCVVADVAVGRGEGVTEAHAFNTGGSKNGSADEGFVRFTGDFLDGASEQAIAEVRVGVSCTRIEIERLCELMDDDRPRGAVWQFRKSFRQVFFAKKHWVAALVAVPTASVVKE